MTPEELGGELRALGQPAFRARQVFAWLHRGVSSFDEMTDIPQTLRNVLKSRGEIRPPIVKKRLVSALDDTVKYLYRLSDGESVETVRMRYRYGDSVCISTQVGCRMGCGFCASTIGGKVRDLLPSEMLDQVLFTAKDAGQPVSHVVLMGIGEPLDNYDNVLRFLRLLSHPQGLNLSLRHVSLSTCGLVDGIRRLAGEGLGLTLSISLHAPDDETRSRIMPVNRRWGVDELLAATKEYASRSGRRVSYEYAMIAGVNDTPRHAELLARKLKGSLCHVNLIPANPVKENGFTSSGAEQIARFQAVLTRNGIACTVRRTLGADIGASCGQLRRAHREEGGPHAEHSGKD